MNPGQVLHLDFISLDPAVSDEVRRALIEEAARLTALDEVLAAGAIEAGPSRASGRAEQDFDIVLWFLLPAFSALEPFGTDVRYTRFLQGTVAPVLRAFAGADVRLDGDFAPPEGGTACLALTAPDETYDWELREALSDWTEGLSAGTSAIGLAVGERQRFRGVAIVSGYAAKKAAPPADSRFLSTLVLGQARRIGYKPAGGPQ